MDVNLKEVGARIRQARKERSISQAELAEKLNISVSHMSDIETGRSNFGVDIFMRITEVLQVSADALLRTNVPAGNAVYSAEFEELMKGCSYSEKETMLRVLHIIKDGFVNNRK